MDMDIHGYPQKICGYGYEHGCEISYPRQPWEWYECPLVVHYWADLQSVHEFRCYDNIHVHKLIALYTANAYSAEREISTSACTCCMPG